MGKQSGDLQSQLVTVILLEQYFSQKRSWYEEYSAPQI